MYLLNAKSAIAFCQGFGIIKQFFQQTWIFILNIDQGHPFADWFLYMKFYARKSNIFFRYFVFILHNVFLIEYFDHTPARRVYNVYGLAPLPPATSGVEAEFARRLDGFYAMHPDGDLVGGGLCETHFRGGCRRPHLTLVESSHADATLPVKRGGGRVSGAADNNRVAAQSVCTRRADADVWRVFHW